MKVQIMKKVQSYVYLPAATKHRPTPGKVFGFKVTQVWITAFSSCHSYSQHRLTQH